MRPDFINQTLVDFLHPTIWKRRLAFLIFDAASFSASIVLAVWVRFEFQIPHQYGRDLGWYLIIFVLVKISIFAFFRLYEVSWSDFSLRDLTNLVKAGILAQLVLTGIVFYLDLEIFKGFPRRVLLMDWFAGLVLCSGFRIAKRVFFEILAENSRNGAGLNRTLIVGAGHSGEQLLRDVHRKTPRPFLAVALVDDDPRKKGLYIQGVPVAGVVDDLPRLIRERNVQSVIVAVPSADRTFHHRIFVLARAAGVRDVKVVSAINDISNVIQVGIRDLRDIDITDLIGRQAVTINTLDISAYLKGKRVLITGASGSIGSEISRQVCFYSPASVILLDINESDLVTLVRDLRAEYELPVHMFLGDVSDRRRMAQAFSEFQPEVVFHAAAYKHVPVLEKFPGEAVRVNILGTYNLALLAREYGVRNFVLISTDKAVNPSSIMGVSKRIAEYIITALGSNASSGFVAVRFGNVIGSRGSVLPMFVDQIKRGGPVTITHPDMKRYFMMLQEAVALVLQAAAIGTQGDVFVLDMGEPLRIVDIARELIALNGLVPDKDIKIEFTGLRNGEKLFEELLTSEEGVDATVHNKIFRARLATRHTPESISSVIEQFQKMNGTATRSEWVSFLQSQLPMYKPIELLNHFNSEAQL